MTSQLDKRFGPFVVTPQGGTHTESYAVRDVKVVKIDGSQIEVVNLKDDGKPTGDPYHVLPSSEGSRLSIDGKQYSVWLRGRRVTRGDLRQDMVVTLAEPRTFAFPGTPEHKRIPGHRYEPFKSHMPVDEKLNKGRTSTKFELLNDGHAKDDEIAKLRRRVAELEALTAGKPADDKNDPKGQGNKQRQMATT